MCIAYQTVAVSLHLWAVQPEGGKLFLIEIIGFNACLESGTYGVEK